MTQNEVRITLGEEQGLACLAVAHDDLAARGSDEGLVRVIVAGDLCWTPRPGIPEPSELDDSPWPGFVSLLAAQDLSIVNLEAAITDLTEPIAKCRRPRPQRACVRAIWSASGGFDAVCLANNHVGDFGGARDRRHAQPTAVRPGCWRSAPGADSRSGRGSPSASSCDGLRFAIIAASEANLGVGAVPAAPALRRCATAERSWPSLDSGRFRPMPRSFCSTPGPRTTPCPVLSSSTSAAPLPKRAPAP